MVDTRKPGHLGFDAQGRGLGRSWQVNRSSLSIPPFRHREDGRVRAGERRKCALHSLPREQPALIPIGAVEKHRRNGLGLVHSLDEERNDRSRKGT